jgi:hypothetical protein
VELTEPGESIDAAQYHIGSGWYQLPDGRKARGRAEAERLLRGD